MSEPASSNENPQRLDHAVAALVGMSRRQAQQLITDGAVHLNGRIATTRAKGRLVTPGDRVEVDLAAATLTPNPELPLSVLAEGDGWVVCDKPAGMAMHPLHGSERGTLLNAAAARYPQLLDPAWIGDEGPLRKGVAHRLDLDTTGCVAIALNQPTWLRLREAFRGHRVRKVYHALVHTRGGGPEAAALPRGWRRLSLPLAVTRHKPAHVSVVAPHYPHARQCTLSYRAIEVFSESGVAYLEIELETGFLHQVRVMLAHEGLPLVGDGPYGQAARGATPPEPLAAAMASRHMLHAAQLAYEEIAATSPLPSDMRAVLAACRDEKKSRRET